MIRQSSLILACTLLSACGSSGDESSAGKVASSANARITQPPAFAVCSGCHAVVPGAHGAGPSLAGVWGRKAGSLSGYPYSVALKGSGVVWNAATLDTWLAGPMKMVPGTRMVIGVPDAQGRKAVIDYLQKLK